MDKALAKKFFQLAGAHGRGAPAPSRIFKTTLAVAAALACIVGIAREPYPCSFRSVWAAEAEGPSSVRAVVEKDSVAVGKPFMLQIRLEGSDIAPGAMPPDTSKLSDFTVDYLGGQDNSSSSITIINGRMSKVESHGYVYSYQLAARKAGKLQIPSIPVPVAGGKTRMVYTDPIGITASAAETSDDFHLDLNFSKMRFYVGEPVVLTVVWSLGRNAESAAFDLPILDDQDFTFVDLKKEQDPGKNYFQIRVGGKTILAEKGVGVKNGREYTTLSFSKALFAKSPGVIETPEARVSCRVLVGYSRPQPGRNPFDNFFGDDFFQGGRTGVYKTFVARSRPEALTILPLPEEGRPADFSGLVGRFHVEASADPVEVNVGDPITLTVSIGGPDYLDNVELPALAKDPEIAKSFKTPDEMAVGVVSKGVKRFTQTLRPMSVDAKAIPPIRLSYFNPDAGRYEIAQSSSIPLTVKPTKILTSADVEGEPGGDAPRRSELEDWSRGIAYNYEGPQLLEREVYRISDIVSSPVWLSVVLIPFFSFALLLAAMKLRQGRMAGRGRRMSRTAVSRFSRRVHAIEKECPHNEACGEILKALREFLGDKLGSNGSVLTFNDVDALLKDRGIDAAPLERLRRVFDACELGGYGGGNAAVSAPLNELAGEAIETVKELDRLLR